MFNFTKFLKTFDTSIRWNTRVTKYIKDNKVALQFNKSRSEYFTSVDTAVGAVKCFNIDEVLKLNIINELLERKVLELKSASLSAPKVEKKETNSLDSTHYNIYGVKNMQELALNILRDIEKSEPKNIKNVFKEYVYCFTYMYKYNSITNNLTVIRNTIRNSDLDEDIKKIALEEFKMPSRIYDSINDGSLDKKNKNMSGVLEPIDLPFLNRFFLKAKKYLDYQVNKHNKTEVYTFLASMTVLATGRRLDEIIHKSKFEKISEYKIKVTGLAKKREEIPTVITIPTLLASADEVLKAIDIVKAQIPKGLKSLRDQIKYAHNLADVKKHIDPKLWATQDIFKYQRAIYAVTAELVYNQNNINEENRLPQATFMQRVLGHEDKDFSTYEYYYKRQALVRNFDLPAYLERAKTAMI